MILSAPEGCKLRAHDRLRAPSGVRLRGQLVLLCRLLPSDAAQHPALLRCKSPAAQPQYIAEDARNLLLMQTVHAHNTTKSSLTHSNVIVNLTDVMETEWHVTCPSPIAGVVPLLQLQPEHQDHLLPRSGCHCAALHALARRQLHGGEQLHGTSMQCCHAGKHPTRPNMM